MAAECISVHASPTPVVGNEHYFFSFSQQLLFSSEPGYNRANGGCTTALWGILLSPLTITITSYVSLPQFGLELILSVGSTFADALTQTDHNCFFFFLESWPAVRQLKHDKQMRAKGEQDRLRSSHSDTRIFFSFFLAALCPLFPQGLTPPQWFSHLAVHIRTSSLPANLPVHPTKSICSDLWCRAAPQCRLTAGELLEQHTFLFGCLSLFHTHIHSLLHSCQSALYQYARHFIVHNKGLRLTVVNAYVV